MSSKNCKTAKQISDIRLEIYSRFDIQDPSSNPIVIQSVSLVIVTDQNVMLIFAVTVTVSSMYDINML